MRSFEAGARRRGVAEGPEGELMTRVDERQQRRKRLTERQRIWLEMKASRRAAASKECGKEEGGWCDVAMLTSCVVASGYGPWAFQSGRRPAAAADAFVSAAHDSRPICRREPPRIADGAGVEDSRR